MTFHTTEEIRHGGQVFYGGELGVKRYDKENIRREYFVLDFFTTPIDPRDLRRGTWFTSFPISPKDYRAAHPGTSQCGYRDNGKSITIYDDWDEAKTIEAPRSVIEQLIAECVEWQLPRRS